LVDALSGLSGRLKECACERPVSANVQAAPQRFGHGELAAAEAEEDVSASLDHGSGSGAHPALDSHLGAALAGDTTRRRVRPRLWPHRPLLVWIDITDVRIEVASPMSQP